MHAREPALLGWVACVLCAAVRWHGVAALPVAEQDHYGALDVNHTVRLSRTRVKVWQPLEARRGGSKL